MSLCLAESAFDRGIPLLRVMMTRVKFYCRRFYWLPLLDSVLSHDQTHCKHRMFAMGFNVCVGERIGKSTEFVP